MTGTTPTSQQATAQPPLVEAAPQRLRRELRDQFFPAVALLASLVLVAPLVGLAGASPLDGYMTLFEASFGSTAGFAVMVQFSVPLILVGLGVAVPLRMGLFNIGGEGQLITGALAATFVGSVLHVLAGWPGSFVLPLAAGFAAGGVIGGLAGALKAWRGINEIITTIMLNFVALLFVQYWIVGPFKDEELTFAATPAIDPGYALERIGDDQIPFSILVALAASVLVSWAVHYTRPGWRLHVAGVNPRLAARQRISVARLQFVALAAGGALAGLGGAAEVIGNQLRVSDNFSPGWGFDAIAIAVLARNKMLAVIPYAVFFAFLRNGAGVLQTDLDVPGSIAVMLAGMPVMVVAAIVGYRAYVRPAGRGL
jgi:simple sugar transport system permease protein